MLAVAQEMDSAGFKAAEVIATSHFKKCVRDLREDPWERIRVVAEAMPNTKLAAMGYTPATFKGSPLSLIELYISRLAANGIRRLHVMDASNDMSGQIVDPVKFAHAAGIEVMVALVFSESPKHTDEYYSKKAQAAISTGADCIYLKDPGGLITPQRIRTLVPAILQAAQGVPIEFHTHCTTGLGPVSVLEAVRSGINTVHTAIPPLANGASQPSLFNIASNLKESGFDISIDESPLQRASEELFRIGKLEGLPSGQALEYDFAQYLHQVPGGVISNLKHQLTQMRMLHRLNEVLTESMAVRKELGYPIMVTPFSQFVVSQAAINVLSGERYKVVTDEVIGYALGSYGTEASSGVDCDIRNQILKRPRAEAIAKSEQAEPSLKEIREAFGGSHISDDELLLRYVTGGSKEVAAMRETGRFKSYSSNSKSLVQLLETTIHGSDAGSVSLKRPGISLSVNKTTIPNTLR